MAKFTREQVKADKRDWQELLSEAVKAERELAEMRAAESAQAPVAREVEWLHKFINCVPFGEHAPASDIQRAHEVVNSLSAQAEALKLENVKLRGWVLEAEQAAGRLQRKLNAASSKG